MAADQNDQDVVELLKEQHQQIRSAFDEVTEASGKARTDAFRSLVRLLAVHETAEEEIVHPAVRDAEGGEPVVDARVAEESKAKKLLSTMEEMGPEAEGFDTLLIQLQDDVTAHATHEEEAEFPLLRTTYDAQRLRDMAKAVRAAESLARPIRIPAWTARRPTCCWDRQPRSWTAPAT